MADGQLQEELDALAVELDRSLTIDSPDGELIAYSAQREDDADQARVSSILLRRVVPEVRAWELLHTGDVVSAPVTIPANPALGLSGRICVPLVHGGHTLGCLWMIYSGDPLRADEELALARGAEALARLLANPNRRPPDARSPGREIDRMVGRLFEDGQATAYDQFAVAVPGIVDGTVRLVAAVAGDGDQARSFRASEFNTLSGSLTPILRPKPGYLGSHVTMSYALIAIHDEACDPVELFGEIDRVVGRCLASNSRFSLGISNSTPLGPRSARDARTQALAAAELALLDPVLDRRSYWSRVGAYRLLIGKNRTQLDGALAPLDDAGSSAPMLLETLEVFLDLAGDIQAVAAKLTLHRSSLYYRLGRIAQLLSVDLSDGKTRLDLHIALKQRRARRRTLK